MNLNLLHNAETSALIMPYQTKYYKNFNDTVDKVEVQL